MQQHETGSQAELVAAIRSLATEAPCEIIARRRDGQVTTYRFTKVLSGRRAKAIVVQINKLPAGTFR